MRKNADQKSVII